MDGFLVAVIVVVITTLSMPTVLLNRYQHQHLFDTYDTV